MPAACLLNNDLRGLFHDPAFLRVLTRLGEIYRGDKAVPFARYGSDVTALLGSIAQGTAHGIDVLTEIDLLHKTIRPYRFH